MTLFTPGGASSHGRHVRCDRKGIAYGRTGCTFAVALYARTRLCRFWRAEKRLYAQPPEFVQQGARMLFSGWSYLVHWGAAVRYNMRRRAIGPDLRRGMEFGIDVHDWLGGYRYEAIAPDEMRRTMTSLGSRKWPCL